MRRVAAVTFSFGEGLVGNSIDPPTLFMAGKAGFGQVSCQQDRVTGRMGRVAGHTVSPGHRLMGIGTLGHGLPDLLVALQTERGLGGPQQRLFLGDMRGMAQAAAPLLDGCMDDPALERLAVMTAVAFVAFSCHGP